MSFSLSTRLRDLYDGLVMRGVPRPLLAFACALLLVCSALGLAVGVVTAFIVVILLMETDIPLFIALVLLAVVTFCALVIYQHLPGDPRKSKSTTKDD